MVVIELEDFTVISDDDDVVGILKFDKYVKYEVD